MSEKNSFWEWLGYTDTPNWGKARGLGGFLGFAVLLVALVIGIAGLAGLIKALMLYVMNGDESGDPSAAARNIGLLLAAAFGAPFVAWQAIVRQKQTDIAEQGLITDRLNKAIEGLSSEKVVKFRNRKITVERPHETQEYFLNEGDILERFSDEIGRTSGDWSVQERTVPNLEARIGAIFSLERIAQDSLRDHLQIMEILCAYVRENAPAKNMEPSGFPFKKARADIQTAIRVIGRRSDIQKSAESQKQFRLDLRNVDLSGADFTGLDFTGAIFFNSKFEGAIFQDSKLSGANFNYSLLNFSDFRRSELIGCQFENVSVTVDGGMQFLNFTYGNTYGSSILGANLTGLRYIRVGKIENMLGSKDTIFGEGKLKTDWENSQLLIGEYQLLSQLEDGARIKEIWTELEAKGLTQFVEWSTYTSSDFANYEIREAFAKKRGLIGWPYWY
ncbi:pentapeptide repeat-containing protein [Celeribacter sp. HF31]|uniref:pentapeptide repeat-containing protein n=1 Tax=Celeribacter sp. HF31 TaxID=2721558 RepID=UPI0014309704|nr:pentapeptide repeat-containing protein [Celeribacter sp. HF31]NIY79039.1 pentapeptide repeat-containing protein [Celeribacter sp. HF31]